MAYMNQEKKKGIRAELKKVVPTDWKWSLAVRHHSTIVFTVQKGPKELLADSTDHHTPNEYYLENSYSGELLDTMEKIKAALNLNNFDNSEPMTDYFHVGHYIDIQIGKWNKPFVVA